MINTSKREGIRFLITMNKNSEILILGSTGLVGSSLVRVLKENGFLNLLTPTRKDLDLMIQADVDAYFKLNKPNIVIDAAAKVGGIHANSVFKADFILENLTIQNNIFKASFENETEKLLFLGSSCIYPRNSKQPIKEEYLLTGELEPTNEPYAIAKIAGLKTAESLKTQYGKNFFSLMPTNLYGINDNFHPENGHVLPALVARMQKAIDEKMSTFEVWGSGNPKREFLYVDDLARACMFILKFEGDLPSWLNVGTGKDISIKELVGIIADIMGYSGNITFNTERPDGTMRKVLDVSKIHALGWKHSVELREGIQLVVDHFRENKKDIRKY